MLIGLSDIKAHDEYTYYHSVSVATLSILLGVARGMSRPALYKLGMGALLHDVGKVFIPREIVQKPGALTDEEYEEMKHHSLLGYDYLREYWAGPAESIVAVLAHHERYDGSGYPLGLSGDKQPLEARIVALSDVYDAMTSERPYRGAIPPSEAIEHIMGNSGTMFDPQLVSIFMKKITPYPVGSRVCLSNGQRAIVVNNHADSLMRPKVKRLHMNEQTACAEDEIMDLLNDPAYWNVTILGLDK
jgi:HD-GYP domain-containing protein (c-di-GMP phosphodiesterase class II)